ncbi:Gx transporter family protein [Methyloversatilis sp.]|uniref:Gx transporter family protein n=1 Tax=Methyloversatilis sp. TaxID=2569862 RepID=UPI0027359EBE|nr:Gx transporter family protein [Methyloversatilis sp.]MDP2869867.1 Gx transporter family protein [Methyloversatilis sp.]MDP3289017.1 Gx transporter family protein [Methyloversatilis sp.]MDP3456434.1 Gx transporter family protein [Methyloversatilis sp.]MDP3576708.1 Gx transporter family protein [Methyloversatilis sp.]
MSSSATTLQVEPSARDRRLARYAAAAIAASLVEAAIPSPLPGVKPGLANIVILIVLARHGWRDAAWVSVLRVVAGSLLAGQFLAPGFFLAGAGALASLAALGVLQAVSWQWLGPIGRSVAAAFAHIGAQLVLARLWLVPHDGLFNLAPVFFGAALLFGILNGIVAGRLMQEKT